MQKIQLFIAFGLTAFFSFFGTLFFPDCRLVAFAPLLALLLRRFSLLPLLWWAIAIGLIADSTSIHYRFGLSVLAYMFALSLLYPFRRHFFEDKALPFIALTYLLACLVGIFFTLAAIYKGTIHFPSFFHFVKEIFISPCIDAFIGFVFVFLPLKLQLEIQKRGFKKMLSPSEDR